MPGPKFRLMEQLVHPHEYLLLLTLYQQPREWLDSRNERFPNPAVGCAAAVDEIYNVGHRLEIQMFTLGEPLLSRAYRDISRRSTLAEAWSLHERPARGERTGGEGEEYVPRTPREYASCSTLDEEERGLYFSPTHARAHSVLLPCALLLFLPGIILVLSTIPLADRSSRVRRGLQSAGGASRASSVQIDVASGEYGSAERHRGAAPRLFARRVAFSRRSIDSSATIL